MKGTTTSTVVVGGRGMLLLPAVVMVSGRLVMWVTNVTSEAVSISMIRVHTGTHQQALNT